MTIYVGSNTVVSNTAQVPWGSLYNLPTNIVTTVTLTGNTSGYTYVRFTSFSGGTLILQRSNNNNY